MAYPKSCTRLTGVLRETLACPEPLTNRIEYVHTRDVGLVIARAVTAEGAWGKVSHIGGGSCCQYTYWQGVELFLEAMGLGMLPDERFSTASFSTDWLDTAEARACCVIRGAIHKTMRARLPLAWRSVAT